MSNVKKVAMLWLSLSVLSACTSGQIKARKEMRDKAAQSSHLYCDFINGETYPDVDVAVNLEMAKRCDSEGQMTITSYHSPSEAVGLVYCCKLKADAGKDDRSSGKPSTSKSTHDAKAGNADKSKAAGDDTLLPEVN